MRWKPILRGAERARALEVVEEIAVELRNPARLAKLDPAKRASLAGGRAGLALLHACLGEACGGDPDVAAAFLDQAGKALAYVALPPSLYEGFPGIAWAMEHLERRCGPSDSTRPRSARTAA